jgi:hypothetical protein
MKLIAWMTIGLLLAGPGAAAQDAYLCIADALTLMTFHKDKGVWEPTSGGGGQKFLLKRAGADRWGLLPFGHDDFIVVCPKEISPDHPKSGVGASDEPMECSDYYHVFLFSKKTLRFQFYHVGSYVTPSGEGDDPPGLWIGKCSPL